MQITQMWTSVRRCRNLRARVAAAVGLGNKIDLVLGQRDGIALGLRLAASTPSRVSRPDPPLLSIQFKTSYVRQQALSQRTSDNRLPCMALTRICNHNLQLTSAEPEY